MKVRCITNGYLGGRYYEEDDFLFLDNPDQFSHVWHSICLSDGQTIQFNSRREYRDWMKKKTNKDKIDTSTAPKKEVTVVGAKKETAKKSGTEVNEDLGIS